jgi:hypothetical protein
MFGDVRRCSEMFGDVRRCSEMFVVAIFLFSGIFQHGGIST